MHSEHEPSASVERTGYEFAKWVEIQETIRRLIHAVQWLGIAYIAYLAVDSLAGKTTVFDATFEHVARNRIGTVSPGVVAAMMAYWAFRERKIRLRMEKMHRHTPPGGDGPEGGTGS